MMKGWTGIGHALGGALLLALASTVGDFIWAHWQVAHRVVYGVIHGSVMCLCIGLVLGWRPGTARGLRISIPACVIGGTLISAAFYPLYHLMGNGAMIVCWMLLWIAFAAIGARVRQESAVSPVLGRGILAALCSGAGFYPIYLLWTGAVSDPSYLQFLLAWLVAFLPGFLFLLVRRAD